MNAISPSAPNKSLREIANPSYDLGIESYVQAPTEAPIFLTSARDAVVDCGFLFESNAPANLLFSETCTLFKTRLPQPTPFQSLAHSLKNNPGVWVEGSSPPLPILERLPCSRVRFPERGPLHLLLATMKPPHRPSARGRTVRTPDKFGPSRVRRFSLAIKKQSIPNLPSIGGNERKANDVYKVFHTDLQEIDR